MYRIIYNQGGELHHYAQANTHMMGAAVVSLA